MNATAAPRLVINGQTVSTSMTVIPGLDVSVDVLVGVDPAFPDFCQMVSFDPITDWLCQGAEFGDAVICDEVHIFDDSSIATHAPACGSRPLLTCDCHGLVWPDDMLTYRDGPGVLECPLPRDDQPLPRHGAPLSTEATTAMLRRAQVKKGKP